MPKNLIVCCDGTGNRGGVTPDSNVYRVFNGIQRRSNAVKQVAYYDDGVGTDSNKYFRLLGGAMGWGFSSNVEDAYCFLCRNYQGDAAKQTGDRIYLFGFSRGAYTVRALAALVVSCGILRANQVPDELLRESATRLRRAYGRFQAARRFITAERRSQGVYRWWYRLRTMPFLPKAWRFDKVTPDQDPTFSRFWASEGGTEDDAPAKARIEVVGVWDTVSALGLPFDAGLKGVVEPLINRYRFVDNYLCDVGVTLGRHALSLDDQRLTFHPELWHEWRLYRRHATFSESGEGESTPPPEEAYVRCKNVDQVWFSGVHSNVGGGYPKRGLDYITLEWMLRDLETKHHLQFKPGFLEEVALHADVHGRLYDSRSGVASYYRYRPRKLRELHAFHRLDAIQDPAQWPGGEAQASVRVHDSVLGRILSRTDSYNPGNLPADVPIQVVDSGVMHAPHSARDLTRHLAETRELRGPAQVLSEAWFRRREILHLSFVMMNLFLAGALLHTEARGSEPSIPPGPLHSEFNSLAALGSWSWHYLIPLALSAVLFWIAIAIRDWARVVPLSASILVVAVIVLPIDFLPPLSPVGDTAQWTLEFLLPDIVAHLLHDVIAQHPGPSVVMLTAVLILFILRCDFRRSSERQCERLNDILRSHNSQRVERCAKTGAP